MTDCFVDLVLKMFNYNLKLQNTNSNISLFRLQQCKFAAPIRFKKERRGHELLNKCFINWLQPSVTISKCLVNFFLFARCQEGTTTAMILKKKLLLRINLGRLGSFGVHDSKVTMFFFFTTGKYFKMLKIIQVMDVPVNSPQCQTVQ